MSSNSTGSTRAIFCALAANGGIAIAKFTAALLTGSGAMLAEAIHSIADCANQVFLLIGLRQAKKPADEGHPMGYGRVVYFWAMMVAILLFFVGGAFSVIEGVRHLLHPEPLKSTTIALSVLGISAVLESFSLHAAMREIRKISNDQNFFVWFRETRQSELMVVAGEDIAALAGLAMAFIAVSATSLTGNPLWDSLGSIAVGILLMLVALIVMREVKGMITGESAAPEIRAAIRRHIEDRPEVDSIINLVTLQWGDQLMIAVQAKMHNQPSDFHLIEAINKVEASLQKRWPQAKWCFFEPDRVGRSD